MFETDGAAFAVALQELNDESIDAFIDRGPDESCIEGLASLGHQLPFVKVRFRDAHQASSRAQSQWSGSVVHDCQVVGVLSLPDQADDKHVFCALEVPDRKREAIQAPSAQPIDVEFLADGR